MRDQVGSRGRTGVQRVGSMPVKFASSRMVLLLLIEFGETLISDNDKKESDKI